MSQKELNEKELLEILELAKEAEQKAKAMCEVITAHTAKYKGWREDKQAKNNTAATKSTQ